MSIAHIDVSTVISRLTGTAYAYEKTVLLERAVHTGLMWRCPCRAVNAVVESACAACTAGRLWTADQTSNHYGTLLDDLRDELKDWFDDRADVRRPAAVGFHVTTQYDDGPAWATWGATAYFPESRTGIEYPHDFHRSRVADALVEISDFDRPQTGDILRVVVPAF